MRDLKTMETKELQEKLRNCIQMANQDVLPIEYREIAVDRAEKIRKELDEREAWKDSVKIAIVVGLIVIGFILTVASCHTVEGFGKDLQDWSSAYTEREVRK